MPTEIQRTPSPPLSPGEDSLISALLSPGSPRWLPPGQLRLNTARPECSGFPLPLSLPLGNLHHLPISWSRVTPVPFLHLTCHLSASHPVLRSSFSTALSSGNALPWLRSAASPRVRFSTTASKQNLLLQSRSFLPQPQHHSPNNRLHTDIWVALP